MIVKAQWLSELGWVLQQRVVGPDEFKLVGDLIFKVVEGLSKNKEDNSKIEKEVQKEIIELAHLFLYSS